MDQTACSNFKLSRGLELYRGVGTSNAFSYDEAFAVGVTVQQIFLQTRYEVNCQGRYVSICGVFHSGGNRM